MQQGIAIKLKFKPSSQQAIWLREMMEHYTQACNWLSKYYFDHGMNIEQTKLQKLNYHYLRSQFQLKSELACSVVRTVTARYKSVNTQMQRTYYHFQDPSTKRWYRVKRNKEWLHHPIVFHRHQADLVRNRDWSFTSGKLSLNTLRKRVQVPYDQGEYFQKYLTADWKLGGGKIVRLGGKWYFHVSATTNVKSLPLKESQRIVGIDRGLRFTAVADDGQKKPLFFDGKAILQKRKEFLHNRSRLQAKDTRSAKRRLKILSGRENRWMSDVNHRISKALVDYYGDRTTFVLEDLSDIRWTLQEVYKKQRYTQVSWAFYQLGDMLTYKAHLHHSRVIHVDAKYTSQRCPNCGMVIKENRHHASHLYRCQHCGYSLNDDLVGARNVRYLGLQKYQGKRRPTIHKMTKIHTSY